MPTKKSAATRIVDSSRNTPARSRLLPSPRNAAYVPDELVKRPNPIRPRIKRVVKTAYHEAGHAVISSALCDTPRMVTIVPRQGEYFGCSTIMDFAGPNVRAQVLLAGLASEHLLTGRIPEHLELAVVSASLLERAYRMDSDIGGAVKCVQQLVSSKRHKKTVSGLMRFYAITRDSLRATWPAVVSVADALLTQQTLDRDSLFEALDAHDIYHEVLAVQKAYSET